MSYYGTVADVKAWSGVVPRSLGLDGEEDPDAALDTLLEKWLTQVKAFIDADRGRAFEEGDSELPIIENISVRMAVNMVRMAELQRSGSVIRVDNYEVHVTEPSIFTEPIRRDLHRVPRKWGAKLGVIGDDDDD